MPRLERCKENRLLQNIQHTGRACRAINKQAQREEESKVKREEFFQTVSRSTDGVEHQEGQCGILSE